MKASFLKASALGLALGIGALAHAEDYLVDKDHSHVGFSVRHLFSKVPGEFRDFEGNFKFDPKNPKTASGKFVVKADTISTNNEKRDAHLKSADFFDVAKYPTITLENVKVAPVGKNFQLLGDLTLHGVTKPVKFELEFLGTDKDPWGNQRSGFTASARISRKDFGLSWNKVLESGKLLVGDEVELSFQVEAIQQKAKM